MRQDIGGSERYAMRLDKSKTMSEPRTPRQSDVRAERILNKALQARLSVALLGLALVGSAISLASNVASAQTVGPVLGFIALLFLLAQIAGRSYLMQTEQRRMLLQANRELETIRRNTEEELRVEEKQTRQLELLFTAMREFELIKVKSLEALQENRPTTSFYLQRHASTIIDILDGRWNRTERLRPGQLWHEYSQLIAQMRAGETFRSTVCVPTSPSDLFADEDFETYVRAIYRAAEKKAVHVKRLFVLDVGEWPPRSDSLAPEVREHFRVLAEKDKQISTLEARVTDKDTASLHFHLQPPDFMMWDDGLLIQSDLNGPGGLVTRADFYFNGNSHGKEIRDRLSDLDRLFGDARATLSVAALV